VPGCPCATRRKAHQEAYRLDGIRLLSKRCPRRRPSAARHPSITPSLVRIMPFSVVIAAYAGVIRLAAASTRNGRI